MRRDENDCFVMEEEDDVVHPGMRSTEDILRQADIISIKTEKRKIES